MTTKDTIKQNFPTEVHFPIELEVLCNWIDENGYDNILTDIKLYGFQDSMTNYFDNGQKLEKYIGAFGHSADGSIFAILQIENNQKVVHLGPKGSNWFIVADNFVEFLKILAIGYPHLTEDDLEKPPIESNPNDKFKKWVETTFNVTIPNSAKKITNKADKTFTKWLFDNLQPDKTFEHFDPESEHNKQFNSIEYRLVVKNVPNNKSKFIGDLRRVSTMSISELLKQLNNLPFVVYESSTYFKGQLSIINFSTFDKDNLIFLTENYKNEVILEYRNNVKKSEKTDFKQLI
ncbi:hypothetical protein ACFQO9_16515 [Chryseobacterium zhengzhouense]|uniref:SMI1/KNR4 family protein n=2 Tax=Chryseobacterium zhengzhouense TaxID=1636086 RepID=A0ABW2M2C3_9FLAO